MAAELHATVVSVRADQAVVAVRGEVDLSTAERLRMLLRRALAAHREVLVDLSGVAFFDCSGLRALHSAHLTAAAAGRRLLLCAVPPPVARVLDATGMASVFPTAPEPVRTGPGGGPPPESGPAPRNADGGGLARSA